MAKLYVSCGIANHAIYVADRDNPLAVPIHVTQSAITAVRDYMVDDIKKGESSVGYQWKRDDGKTVKLVCLVEDTNG